MWVYPVVILVLFGLINLYFKIAERFKIIDKPNERSSHVLPTIRGGGIIFPIALSLYFLNSSFLNSPFSYPYFYSGILLVSIISFIDDIKPLRALVRIPFHLLATGLIIFELGLLNGIEFWIVFIIMILASGIINAYNFMDGINGITVVYSTVTIGTLYFMNKFQEQFVDGQLMLFIICSLIVFAFYNLRKKARCFAGDIGSVSMAFMVLFLLIKIMVDRENIIFILLLSVYGIDTVLTIIHRLFKKENIFKAHRFHLYQIIANRAKVPHIKISFIYGGIQLLINAVVFSVSDQSQMIQAVIGVGILLLLAIAYISLKIHFMQSSTYQNK